MEVHTNLQSRFGQKKGGGSGEVGKRYRVPWLELSLFEIKKEMKTGGDLSHH